MKTLNEIIKFINDKSKASSKHDLDVILYKEGFTRIGKGIAANVYQHEHYGYVIKLFMEEDSGYMSYIEWVQKNPHNKYAPKIKGVVTRFNTWFYGIRLEPLFKIKSLLINTSVTDIFHNYTHRLREGMPYKREDFDDKLVNYYDKFVPGWDKDSDFYNICKFLASHSSWTYDLHDDNLMQRKNGDVVVIDPLFMAY